MTLQYQSDADVGKWRLLFVTNVSWFFVMHRMPLAIMAREHGVDVHVACGEGKGSEDVIAQGIPFHQLPLTRTAVAPLRDLRTLRELVRLYRRLRPDVVHHVTLKPIVYGSLAARIASVPAVVNAFAGLGFVFTGAGVASRLRQSLLLRLLRWSMRLPNQAVVFENNDDKSLLTSAGVITPEQATVMAGVGIDTDKYAMCAQPVGIPEVVLAGRMLREKGVEHFVAAARILKKRNATARFALVGNPDPFNPGSVSEAQLRAWDDEGVVRWRGFQHDILQVLQGASIVCLPTHYREGVPRILMEAAACGRALVATDMPGCRDIVRDGVNGLLVPPHDVVALADALERLINDAELRRKMGAAGRELAVRQFELSTVLAEFWQLYTRLRVSSR